MMHLGEEAQLPTVEGVEVMTAPVAVEPWVRSYGVIDGGFEVMRAAWPKLQHVFSVRRSDDAVQGADGPEPAQIFREPHRLPNNLLTNYPVDLLTIEQGSLTQSPLNYERQPWEKLISWTDMLKQPRVVIKSWPPNAQL